MFYSPTWNILPVFVQLSSQIQTQSNYFVETSFHSKDIFWRYFSKNLLDPFVTNSKFVCWPAWGCGWQSSWSGEHLSNLLALLAVVTSRESAVFVKFSQYSISPKTQR